MANSAFIMLKFLKDICRYGKVELWDLAFVHSFHVDLIFVFIALEQRMDRTFIPDILQQCILTNKALSRPADKLWILAHIKRTIDTAGEALFW